MKNKYRIVRDFALGYEAQVKFWWMPFIWFQMNKMYGVNTHETVEDAEKFIHEKRQSFVKVVA